MLQRIARTVGVTVVFGSIALVLPSTALAGTSVAKAPTRGTTVLLTNSDNGKTVRAAKGDTVVVELKSDGVLRWSEASVAPSSTTSPVLVKTGGQVSPNGSSTTTFLVVGYGSARLDALGRPNCTSVCPQYILLWQATVSVPVHDPPSAS